jgi:membrane protein implicated in regulation of membrane protease activity
LKLGTKLNITGFICLGVALIFLWWALQTAWIGSFPNQDVSEFAFWAVALLLVGLALLVAAVITFLRARKANS